MEKEAKNQEERRRIFLLTFIMLFIFFLVAVGLLGGLFTKLTIQEERLFAYINVGNKFITEKIEHLRNQITAYEKDGSLIRERLEVMTRRDCQDVYDAGFNSSGIYNVTIHGALIEVYCDMNTTGGNWLVLQRRVNASVNFYRNWIDYEHGFGNLNGSFWLGLRFIHYLTILKPYELRIDIEDWNGNTAYAVYRKFEILSERFNYQLQVGNFSGSAGDSFANENGRAFTTKDRDNDKWPNGNCANRYFGGWWYNHCHKTNLNGKYLLNGQVNSVGIVWYHWKSSSYSLMRVEMRIRPIENQ